VLHIIKTTDWKKEEKKKRVGGGDGRLGDARRVATRHLDYRHTQRPVLSVILTLLLFPFFLYLSFVAHEEMRKLIETMPHPTRVDSLSWKLKYFYESCTALEHIVVPEQKLIRVIDQMGMEMHTLSLFSFITIRYLSFLPYPLELIAISQYFEMEREILYKINVNLYTLYNMCVGRFSVMMESKICFFFLFFFFQWTGIMQVAGEFCGVSPSIRGTSAWSCDGCMPSTASTLSSALTLSLIPTFPTRASSE
jgi:hypothetical protein